jgi:hypothetical protein
MTFCRIRGIVLYGSELELQNTFVSHIEIQQYILNSSWHKWGSAWSNLKLIVLRISIEENQNGAHASVQASIVKFYGHLSKG